MNALQLAVDSPTHTVHIELDIFRMNLVWVPD